MNNQQDMFLIREASMSAMALGQGLTHLRKYDFGQTGFFYSSLLQLATGTERILKIILIYNHRLKDSNTFPNNKELRYYGHKINELFLQSINIANDFELTELTDFYFQDVLYSKIINLLSDFALQARYYNLDILTGKQQNNVEPLIRWENEINSHIIERHFRPRKSTIGCLEK